MISPLHAEASLASITKSECGSLTISIKGLRNTNGQLGVALFTSKHGFPDNHENAFAKIVKKIAATDEEVIFDNIPYGSYAVSVLHDENWNGKMDKTFFGIPKKRVWCFKQPKNQVWSTHFQGIGLYGSS